jgi:ATP-dependent DNA helicase RecG
MDSISLTAPVTSLPGVGPIRREQLERLEILSIKDLLYYAPFRYEAIDRPISLADLQPGTKASFKARVDSVLPIKTARFRSMLKAKLSDQVDGVVSKIEVTWFNTPYVLAALKVGQEYYFTGKVAEYKGKLTITNPVFEQSRPNEGELVPIYHETAKLTSRWLRKVIGQILDVADHNQLFNQLLPVEREQRTQALGFVALSQALRSLHQPASDEYLHLATKRLAYDEMFSLIQGVIESKRRFQQASAAAQLTVSNQDIKKFISLLPYQPTESQQAALQAVALDLAQTHPMHRLLQGEVGSGKTTIAAFALWSAAKAGHQVALVCPTKILAEQHSLSLSSLLKSTGLEIGLVTGKTKQLTAPIIVGTHALFHWEDFKPSLVVIDEEHRFGVEQRQHFFKTDHKPHFLSMTATPIPRTVALTALADFDVSLLKPHREANTVKTWVVPKSKRTEAYTWLREQLKAEGKHQAFVVCPFIDTSAIETLGSVKSATSEYKKLTKLFPEQNLTLLHGKMNEEEKSQVFKNMLKGVVDVLVTTPVVEVGVDIPHADSIIIEGAERFGLAQLHQLRGRVGRRGQPAYCLLFVSDDLEGMASVTKRLQYFSQTYDGNALAEYDLKRRGSGELLGTRQHGFGTLQFASWFDSELIELCRKEIEKEMLELAI